ncbi:unnamed protein product, partial [Mesorhabditis belari]|uniref:ABC transmembrane type-1 domain-containing protein n=1 Tax=Mesorhabditis belari TaxID=2138241 RepID=A0AAF3ETK4_9BILA
MSSQGAFGEFLEEYLVEEVKTRGRSVSFGEDAQDMNELLSEIEKLSPDKRKRIESQISQVHSSTESLNKEPASPVRPKTPLSDALAKQNGGQKEEKTEVTKDDEKKALLGKEATPKKDAAKGKLTEKEAMETGKVKWTVYLTYLQAIGYSIALLFFSVYVFSSILGVMSNLWLARWSDDAKKIQEGVNGGEQTRYRLFVYACLGVGQAFSICAASIIMALGMVRASRLLHEGFLRNILNNPMMFFDVTPLGRILNRFGKDIKTLDSELPEAIGEFLYASGEVLLAVMIMLYVSPQASLPTACAISINMIILVRL